MKRINVELRDEEYQYLRGRAQREGRPLVALIREAIATLRGAESRDISSDPMYQVGSFDGPEDLAERHDHYLYGSG